MNYDVLKKQFKDNKLNNIYLIYGDEYYLIDAIIKKLEKLILEEQVNGMTKNEFNGVNDEETILNALNTVPMIGIRKLVICYNSEFFNKNTKNTKIIKLVENINKDTYIIFVEQKVDLKNSLYKAFKTKQFVYNIKLRNSNEIIEHIIKRFKSKKKKITSNNAYLFLEYSGFKLLDIEKDVEKILLFMDEKIEVKAEYIRNLCQGSKEVKIYELTNNIFVKNKKKALKNLKELLADRIAIQMIISVLNTSFMELYEVKLAINSNRTPEILRFNRPIHEYALKKLVSSSKKFTIEKIRKVIKEIADTDINIKYGYISGKIAIELLIIKILI